MRTCSIPGCAKKHHGRGLCQAHYNRYLDHGDPLAGRTPEGTLLEFVEQALATSHSDCVIWPYATRKNGYGVVKVEGKQQLVHRYVCQRANGDAPSKGHEAAHSCGVRSCINPRHVRWATHSENEADKRAHGTALQGERHHKARLTEADVREIRRLAGMVPRAELGRRFDMPGDYIARIQNRQVWRHVP